MRFQARHALIWLVVSCSLSFSASVGWGQALPIPSRQHPPSAAGAMDMRRRLVELDRLLTLKSVGRAESLLEDLEKHSVLRRELISRRIRLAQLRGDHQKAVDICREALSEQPLNAGFWRSITKSLLAVDHPDSARLAAENFIATSPNQRSAGMVTVELFQQAERPVMAVALIDSMRRVLGDKLFMGRQKAVALLTLERYEESADEVVADLRSNPFNLSLVRSEILEGGYTPGQMPDFISRLDDRAEEEGNHYAEVIFAGNLYLMEGDNRRAFKRVRPLFVNRSGKMAVLQNSTTLSRELPLLEVKPEHPQELQATVDYLLEVLGWLIGEQVIDEGIKRKAADSLAAVCGTALKRKVLGDDPQEAGDRFGELLDRVRQVHPQSKFLYSSQLTLAAYTRDVLHQPSVAARRLEGLLLDLDMPLPGVALVRLSLGECYLAAGDTTRGRLVLTRLGRDPKFRKAGGHAHYHLARLDLAQGNLVTARDRFAVVAMDNPAAPYANDALELGLAITEEMDNPTGGPELMLRYSQSVYYDLVADPEQRVIELEKFITDALLMVDMEEPQHLVERARFELASAYAEQGRVDEAVQLFKTIVRDHPRGRFPAESLLLESRLFREMGEDDQALQALELLLAQYPDYLFIDDVRDAVRSLP